MKGSETLSSSFHEPMMGFKKMLQSELSQTKASAIREVPLCRCGAPLAFHLPPEDPDSLKNSSLIPEFTL
jgi:hypothetical protein